MSVTAWLDAVAALPTVGLQVQLPWVISLHFNELMAPEVDRWAPTAHVNATPPNFIVETDDGLRTKLLLDNLIVEGAPRFRTIDDAGSFFPAIEHSAIRPYNELLDAAVERLECVIRAFAGRARFRVQRIGIVANMRFREESLPEGIKALIDHLASPWGGPLVKSETLLMANLAEDEETGIVERCHHHFIFDRSKPPPIPYQVVLDWQRAFPKPLTVEKDAEYILAQLAECVPKARAYFERRSFDGA